jgi:hypothetical protein
LTANPAALARQLHEARAAARATDIETREVTSIDAAYAIKSELIALAGGKLKGWKVTALTP